jgi:hypothetical protein
MLREIKHFLIHLRLHYQFFILSGGYLLGGLLADQMQTADFWLQFLNVHVLLFGGATAFNSYWDKDEGPIGGLKRPPKLAQWTRNASIGLMVIGWIWSIPYGWFYSAVYAISLLLFWLYSTPLARWKGNPMLSLLAIGVSTGTNSVFLGYLAAGGVLMPSVLFGAAGAGLILLSLYPVSQVFQADEDRERGDVTFYVAYGLSAVKSFFSFSYVAGLILITYAIYIQYPAPAILLLVVGLASFLSLLRFVLGLKGKEEEYDNVMKIKFFASLSFVLFLLAANAIRYEWLGKTVIQNYF